jgi:glycyl-tRNA synthetase beta subunit
MYGIRLRLVPSVTLVAILFAGSLETTLYAQRAAKLSPKVMEVINGPVLELKDDDPPLLRLKKERFNAALKEVKARYDLYNRGLTRIPELIDVGERLFAAEVNLYEDDAEKKADALQRQLDVYTEAETNLQKQVKDGLATQADLERLRYDKLTVQINLFKAKNPSAR